MQEASHIRELYQVFMDEAPYSFVLFDSELNYLEINKHCEQYLPSGIKPKDIIGRNLLDVVPSAKESGRYDRYKEVIRTGKQFLFTDVVTYPELGKRTFIIKAFKVANGMGHIGVDITESIKGEEEREQAIKKLEGALSEIQILRGILPICASCKQIRNEEGYWDQVETYLTKHSEVRFSHTLCEKCSEKLHGNEEWFKKMKKT